MKILNDRDSLIRDFLFLMGMMFQLIVTATVISNLGWFHPLSISTYVLTPLLLGITIRLWRS